jgi:hypothetical protein
MPYCSATIEANILHVTPPDAKPVLAVVIYFAISHSFANT